MLHGIHGIQSRCMEYTAFNRDAFFQAIWSALHSITLHGIHCIHSGSISQRCMESTALNLDAWNPLLNRVLWAMLHKIHCI